MGMREKLIELLIVAQDLITLSRKADFLIANDVVPVVRCKDCKSWNRYEPDSVSGRCGFLCKMRMYDDFCSYGERGDGNG